MKPAVLVYVNSNDEKETRRLLQAIRAKQEQIEELTMAMEHLKTEVDLFQHRYDAHVGRYYVELDKVELETKEYRLRLQLYREKVSAEEIEARVASCFKVNRVRVTGYEGEKEEQPKLEEKALPKEEAKHLQTLYRKLAKRYHPDKTVDAEEQHRRKQLMPLINRAYQEQDIQTLARLSLGEIDVAMQREEAIVESPAQLQAELRNLNRATNELRLEINRLKAGRTYQLKEQVENAKEGGTDLLAALAKGLERKVKASRGQLARLINMWHRAKAS